MKSIIGKVLTVSAVVFAMSFLVILLVSDVEHAMFISPPVALLAGLAAFVTSYEKYGLNRIAAGNPIDSKEISQWIANSLLVSVPLLALTIVYFFSVTPTVLVSSLPNMSVMVYLVLLLPIVGYSIIHLATPHVVSVASKVSKISFIQKFNHWLDVKE